ncbi:MAG: hypothetical protein PHG85_07320 [Candidatus Altiarchaeota archaeon]|nr:hypothetical protein [Candidatus Altiarchaeota archaeon]
MDAINVIKESFRAFLENLVAYVIGFLVCSVGSLLIVTAPPLEFGAYYMCLKGARGEKVKITDIFKGFSFFKVSWMYFLFILLIGLAPVLLVSIAAGNAILSPGVFILYGAVLCWILALVFSQTYAIPAIISKNLEAADGAKASMSLVKENLGATILLMICLVAIGMALSLIPIAGGLISGIITSIATSKMYLELQAKRK